MDENIDLREPEGKEIDLRDRLRFAAGSLAADFGDALTADHAEALVFSSAEGLLASASVMEFVPILAERGARLAVRTGVTPEDLAAEPVVPAVVVPEAPSEPRPAPAQREAAEPVIALSVDQLDRLRDRVDRVRVRVSDWRADLDRR